MLPDPLIVYRQASGDAITSGQLVLNVGHPTEFVLIGYPALGASIRVGADASMLGGKPRLSVSHSSSKENAPLGSDRANLRLDLSKVDSEGRMMVGSAYLTTVFPKGGVFSADDQKALVNTLLTLALCGAADEDTLAFPEQSGTLVAALLNGEP